jgi:LmbE family N-acetylglucosaminyl deacetylase
VSPSQVVVVIAHPDDEIFASGTLCLLAEKGLRITIVAMTDGEGGGRDTLPAQATTPLAAIRRHELALSAAALGVAEVLFLSYPDVPPPLGPTPQDWNEAHILAALERILLERRPELILTHGPKGGYGHPAHKLTHRHVMAAATRADFGGCIFSFCGQVKGSPFAQWCDDPSDVLIDARDFLRSRAASLGSHQTQLAFFLQPYFPRTLRDYRSSLIGYALWFTSFGRKRIPIATPTRLFQRHPKEGLVLWKTAKTIGATYFLERFSDDRRVEIVRQRIGPAGTTEDPGLRRTGAA